MKINDLGMEDRIVLFEYAVLMNPQHLLPAQDPSKNKPVNIPELGGSGAHGPLPLTKVLLIVDGCQGKENKFSLKVWSLLDKLGPMESPTTPQIY